MSHTHLQRRLNMGMARKNASQVMPVVIAKALPITQKVIACARAARAERKPT